MNSKKKVFLLKWDKMYPVEIIKPTRTFPS